MERVDDVRRLSAPQYGPIRYIVIEWPGGSIDFRTNYRDFPDLIARLNQACQARRIKRVRRDYTPPALRDARAAATTAQARQAIDKNGTITVIPSLDPAPYRDSAWRFPSFRSRA